MPLTLSGNKSSKYSLKGSLNFFQAFFFANFSETKSALVLLFTLFVPRRTHLIKSNFAGVGVATDLTTILEDETTWCVSHDPIL